MQAVRGKSGASAAADYLQEFFSPGMPGQNLNK